MTIRTKQRYTDLVIIACCALCLSLPLLTYAEGLENPLSYDSIPIFISNVLKAVVMVALPIIALFMVYAGFLFISAQGNPENLSKAKTNFMYVIIGALLILGAWIIATLIGNTVTQLTSLVTPLHEVFATVQLSL